VGFDEQGHSGADGSPSEWEPEGRDGDHLVVPDDISELEADIRAWRREQRSLGRRTAIDRLFFRGRFGLMIPLVLGVLLLAAVSSVVTLIVSSPPPQRPAALPLARTSAGSGREGGLVPDVAVRDLSGAWRSLRTLRPGVLLLAPGGCDCDSAVRDLATSTEHNQLRLTVVGDRPPQLPTDVSSSLAVSRAEPTGRLLDVFRVTDRPVTVLVRADGVIDQVLHRIPRAAVLDDDIAALSAFAPR
jgi:hypothetical protein